MRWKSVLLALCCLALVVSEVFAETPSAGTMELNVLKTIQLEATPVDVAITPDGRRLFVLTDQGEIHVYASATEIESRIPVGKHINRMKAGPGGSTLILGSSDRKTVEIVGVDFIRNIDISGAPFKGPENAPVVITVFDEFQCPHCAALVPVLDQVVEKNPKTVKVAFKHFPITGHKFARKAAIAAMAAGEQGKFWELHDLLFKNYNRLDDKLIEALALGIGLDRKAYEKKLKDPALEQRIDQDIRDGQNAGVRGTPTIFVNGRLLRDRRPEGLQAAIDKELKSRE